VRPDRRALPDHRSRLDLLAAIRKALLLVRPDTQTLPEPSTAMPDGAISPFPAPSPEESMISVMSATVLAAAPGTSAEVPGATPGGSEISAPMAEASGVRLVQSPRSASRARSPRTSRARSTKSRRQRSRLRIDYRLATGLPDRLRANFSA